VERAVNKHSSPLFYVGIVQPERQLPSPRSKFDADDAAIIRTTPPLNDHESKTADSQ
jgi:hypothetical protein